MTSQSIPCFIGTVSDKKQQLLEASIDLFASEGFWNTPTAKIAKHAGVATGTLFNFFPSKDALIEAVYLHLTQEWGAYVFAGYPKNGDVKSCLEHLWFRHIDWAVRFPAHYALKQQLKLSDLLSAETLNSHSEDLSMIYELVQGGFDAGLFVKITVEFFNSLFLAEVDAAVQYALAQDLKDMDLTKLIAQSFDIFWTGVTT